MKVEQLTMVTREAATEAWRKYQEHKAYQTPHDEAIAAIYKHIARGRTVICALESIRQAGLNEQRMPKLAIAPANAERIYWKTRHAHGIFTVDQWHRGNQAARRRVKMDWAQIRSDFPEGEAIVPLIPVHLRPRRGLANYHILWEAEWTRVYPHDPYLLRRFGEDAWLVCAAWDLTPVERAVMASRMSH